MIPVVTTAEMQAIDAAADDPVEVLIDRAGGAVAWAARHMMGGTYGRRVVVVAGKGNNGNDGRAAAVRLRRWGARVQVIAATDAPAVLPECSLVIDAAYGTGLERPYEAPEVVPGTPVLAVDIPSGFHGDTGARLGRPLTAARTVTFAAPKPGLLFAPCRPAAGVVEVADIGLPVHGTDLMWVEDADIGRLVPARAFDHHKWQSAVALIGGSTGMRGAAHLCGRAAMRSGAGYVRWLTIEGEPPAGGPVEVVSQAFQADRFVDDTRRFGAMVVGPGLGTSDAARAALAVVLGTDRPVVLDADALTLLAASDRSLLADRPGPTVVTPHDGEFARMAGHAVGANRIEAAQALAVAYRSIVLLKGPTTVVATPEGPTRVVTAGTAALATAGTGDVLTGILAGFLARGASPFDAAAAAAHLHGLAGAAPGSTPVLSGDLPDRAGAVLSRMGIT